MRIEEVSMNRRDGCGEMEFDRSGGGGELGLGLGTKRLREMK